MTLEGSVFWHNGPTVSIFTQYHDLLFHLALIKRGINSGLPLRGFVLESGVPQIGYHPAFDTTASVLIKGLHLPVDAALFYLVLPVTLLGMLVGIGVLAAAWARSRRAGLLALGFVGLTLAVTTWPKTAVTTLGDLGLTNLRYFLDNPPSVISAVASTACLALLALAPRRRPAGVYVVAGLFAGATPMMKANFAIGLVPAFVLALAVPVLFRRRPWPAAAAGIGAAALAGAVSYPTTRGPAGALALSLERWARTSPSSHAAPAPCMGSACSLRRPPVRSTGSVRPATPSLCSFTSRSCRWACGCSSHWPLPGAPGRPANIRLGAHRPPLSRYSSSFASPSSWRCS